MANSIASDPIKITTRAKAIIGVLFAWFIIVNVFSAVFYFVIDLPLAICLFSFMENHLTYTIALLFVIISGVIHLLTFPVFIIICTSCLYGVFSNVLYYIPDLWGKIRRLRFYLFLVLSIFCFLLFLSLLIWNFFYIAHTTRFFRIISEWNTIINNESQFLLLNFMRIGVEFSYGVISLSLYFLATLIALARVCYECTSHWKSRKKKVPFVLFLRKFRTSSDLIAPVLIGSAIDPDKKCVSLVSPSSAKTLRFLSVSVLVVSLVRRVKNPFSINVEFVYASDKSWRSKVRKLIERAAAIVVDISDVSDNIEDEIHYITQSDKRKKTIFLRMENKKESTKNDLICNRLEAMGFDLTNNIIDYSYSRSTPEYVKSKKKILSRINLALQRVMTPS